MPLDPRPFWFLRHGETDYNAAGLSQGALDIPLNATGRLQARRAGPMLAGKNIVSIVSSPMTRARETAEIVNESLNLPLHFENELHEVVFGGMEGKPLMPWFTEWLAGYFTPQGAESFAEVTIRIEAVMRRVLALPGPVLIIAHGGVFRALRELMQLAPGEGLAANAVPILCEPGRGAWQVKAVPIR